MRHGREGDHPRKLRQARWHGVVDARLRGHNGVCGEVGIIRWILNTDLAIGREPHPLARMTVLPQGSSAVI